MKHTTTLLILLLVIGTAQATGNIQDHETDYFYANVSLGSLYNQSTSLAYTSVAYNYGWDDYNGTFYRVVANGINRMQTFRFNGTQPYNDTDVYLGNYEDYMSVVNEDEIYVGGVGIRKINIDGTTLWWRNSSTNQPTYWFNASAVSGCEDIAYSIHNTADIEGGHSVTYLHADEYGVVTISDGDTCQSNIDEFDTNGNRTGIGHRPKPTAVCSTGDNYFGKMHYMGDTWYVYSDAESRLYTYYRNVGPYQGGGHIGGQCNPAAIEACWKSNQPYNGVLGRCIVDGHVALVTSNAAPANISWGNNVPWYTGNMGTTGSDIAVDPIGYYLYTDDVAVNPLNYNTTYMTESLNYTVDLSAYDGYLYGRNSTHIIEYDVGDMSVKWNYSKTGGTYAPVITPDYLIDMSSNENWSIHSRNTGEVLWWRDMTDYGAYTFCSRPKFTSDGTYDYQYTVCNNGRVFYTTTAAREAPPPGEEGELEDVNVSACLVELETGAPIRNTGVVDFCRWCSIQETCLETTRFTTNALGCYSGTVKSGEYHISAWDSLYAHGRTLVYDDLPSSLSPFYKNISLPAWNVNATAYNGYDLTAPLGNVTIRYVNGSANYQNATNGAGNAKILFPTQIQRWYDVAVSKPGYETIHKKYYYNYTCTDYLDATAGNYACWQPVYYLFPLDTVESYINVVVYDHLSMEPLPNANIQIWHKADDTACATYYHNFDADYSAISDADGKGYFTLVNGSYCLRVRKQSYQDYEADKAVRDNAVWGVALKHDYQNISKVWMAGRFYENSVGTYKIFYLDCTPADTLIEPEIYVVETNSSGSFNVTELIPNSRCDPKLQPDSSTIIESKSIFIPTYNFTHDINYGTEKSYYTYVGNMLIQERILGATISLYRCGTAAWGDCIYQSSRYDGSSELLRWYLKDNVNYSFKAEKNGWSTGYDNFTTNHSIANETYRVIGLTPDNGTCRASFFFNTNSYWSTPVLLDGDWIIHDPDNGTIYDSGDFKIQAEDLAERGTFVETVVRCNTCVNFRYRTIGDIPFIYDGYIEKLAEQVLGICIIYPWKCADIDAVNRYVNFIQAVEDGGVRRKVVFDETAYACVTQPHQVIWVQTAANLIDLGAENESGFYGEADDQAWWIFNNPVSGDNWLGYTVRAFLQLLGFNPDTSILILMFGLSLIAVFSVLFIPTVIMWRNFLSGRRV